jgi:hypothetical protein
MSIFPKVMHGHFDEEGNWHRDKFCFVACPPEKCNCMPRHKYIENHLDDGQWHVFDTTKVKKDE